MPVVDLTTLGDDNGSLPRASSSRVRAMTAAAAVVIRACDKQIKDDDVQNGKQPSSQCSPIISSSKSPARSSSMFTETQSDSSEVLPCSRGRFDRPASSSPGRICPVPEVWRPSDVFAESWAQRVPARGHEAVNRERRAGDCIICIPRRRGVSEASCCRISRASISSARVMVHCQQFSN